MDRSANSTIKGFLYQFGLTFNKILTEDPKSIIHIEGLIEDIDVITSEGTNAIQCKYHESNENFSLSSVYKPILQMMIHYSNSTDKDVTYHLHSFFPNQEEGLNDIKEEDLKTILSSSNIEYLTKYISKIKKPTDPSIKELFKKGKLAKDDKDKISKYYKNNEITPIINLKSFLGKFVFKFGVSYDSLIQSNINIMVDKWGFSIEDASDVFYPNAIHSIASISSIKEDEDRKVLVEDFMNNLKLHKKTTISRWTLELYTKHRILKQRRKELSSNLNINKRKRCFIINKADISDFDDKIIIFIHNMTRKYCSKIRLHLPYTIFILGADKNYIDSMIPRLYKKGVEVETGYRGEEFFHKAFTREPKRVVNQSWFEFTTRIIHNLDDFNKTLEEWIPDDLFIVAKTMDEDFVYADINIEHLNVSNINDLEYLLKLKEEI